MVPSQTNNKQNNNGDCVFYNNSTSAMNQFQFVEGYNYNNYLRSEFVVRHMAEEESSSIIKTISTTHHQTESQPEPEPEVENISTTKEEEEKETEANNNNNNNNWLQLSIGFNQSNTNVTTTTNHDRDHHHQAPTSSSRLLELDLLPKNRASSRPNLEQPTTRGCSSFGSSLLFEQTTSSSSSSSMSMSMPSGPTYGHQQQQHQNQNLWTFGPLLPHSIAIMPSSTSYIPSYSSSQSCSSLRPNLGPYNYPFYQNAPFHFPSSSSSSSSGFDQFDVAGPSSSHVAFRVVDPPRRPHSGIWFMLQASQNQVKEPFLPQIPKNYLRIKDGRMTVRLLLKYLVSKLKLESESEIEITCKGQQLLPFLTLQHVRDNIWTPRDTTRSLLSDSSTTDHVMVLHYGRSTS